MQHLLCDIFQPPSSTASCQIKPEKRGYCKPYHIISVICTNLDLKEDNLGAYQILKILLTLTLRQKGGGIFLNDDFGKIKILEIQ